NDEKSKRKILEKQLQAPHNDSTQLPNQITSDEKPKTVPSHPTDSRVEPTVQARPAAPFHPTDLILADYCPALVERLKENPKFLTKYRDEAKQQLNAELDEYENLGISETDTRLTDLDFRTKMESVLQTRYNIQADLPDFERIRANLVRLLDRRVNERLDVRRSITSIRSTGSKLVTFEDEQRQSKNPSPKHDNTKKQNTDHRIIIATDPPKTKHDHSRPTMKHLSDDDVTISNASDSDEDTQPTRPGVASDIRPPPRKTVPPPKTTHGIGSLVDASVRPSTTNEASTISALPRQQL
ncbi:unnamed protein product, partial [Rotaria magnacalcarata]